MAVVERLREVGAVGVMGNHDLAACGGLSLEDFNPDARAASEWTRNRMSESTRAYLAALPRLLVPAGSGFTLAHGSPRDPIWEYLDSPWAAQESLAAIHSPHCLVGHTHVPVVFRERRRGGMEAHESSRKADCSSTSGGSCSTPAASDNPATATLRPAT